MEAERWVLWRQDDNGASAVIERFAEERSAREKMEELEARGHKQLYWVEQEKVLPVLNLVVIRSRDLEKAQVFYEAIGLSFERHQHGSGPIHLACERDGLVFEIYPTKKEGVIEVRLGFMVRSLDGVLEGIANAGGNIVQTAEESPWGRRAVVEDPDGHKVELVEVD